MRFAHTALLASLIAAAPGLASAGTLGGVTLPDTDTAGGKKLLLNGLGMREATVFKVDVYVAGLYLEEKSKSGKAVIGANKVKRIVMEFVREVDRGKLVKAWNEGFEQSPGAKGALKDRVDQFNATMSDVKKGDQITMTYVPGKGTHITVRGKDKGTIAGADFASALFHIWLGPKPPNKGLRKGMLGG